MAYTISITDVTNHISFSYSSGLQKNVIKTHVVAVDLNKDRTSIIIHLAQSANRHGQDFIELPYANVSSPVTTSISQLRDVLVGYINTAYTAYYRTTFTNADLVAGVLTINHSLAATDVLVVVRDPSGVEQIMSDTFVDADTTTIDFGGAIGAGTWTVTVYKLV
jgi:hypothetical protein